MKKLIATICGCCALHVSYAQDSIRFKILAETENYKDIIAATTKPDTLSAPALYYLGLAYHMESQDSMALLTLDKSIEKSPKDFRPYQMKGTMLNFTNRFQEAIPVFEKALACDINAKSYEGIGIANYYLQKYPQALEAFTKASKLPDADSRASIMIGQVYLVQNENEKALAIFYNLKESLNKDDESYKTALYNIVDLENKEGRGTEAIPIVEELLAMDSTDYEAISRMIQIHYHNKDYAKGDVLKAKMYAAQRDGKFANNRFMNDRFCFDKFRWTDRQVEVYERYEHGNSSSIYNKIIFVILNGNDVDMTIQTEYSPIAIELGAQPYILCGSKGSSHLNYGLGFDDNSKYEDLKSAVLKILDKKKNAVAGTTPGQ